MVSAFSSAENIPARAVRTDALHLIRIIPAEGAYEIYTLYFYF